MAAVSQASFAFPVYWPLLGETRRAWQGRRRGRRGRECKRHGTVSIVAAMNTVTGESDKEVRSAKSSAS